MKKSLPCRIPVSYTHLDVYKRQVLVLGNHDRHRTPAQWRSLGFAEAVPWPLVWEEIGRAHV